MGHTNCAVFTDPFHLISDLTCVYSNTICYATTSREYCFNVLFQSFLVNTVSDLFSVLGFFGSFLFGSLFLVYFYFSLSSVSCNLHWFLSSVSCNLHFSLSSVSCNLVEILKKNSFVMKTDPISSAPFSPKYFLSFIQILIFEQCVEPKPVWRGGGYKGVRDLGKTCAGGDIIYKKKGGMLGTV